MFVINCETKNNFIIDIASPIIFLDATKKLKSDG